MFRVITRYFAGDRRNLGIAWLSLFGVVAAHSLLETARDALLLSKIPAARLPLVYLAIAALTLALSTIQNRVPWYLRKRASLTYLLLAGSAGTFAFYFFVQGGSEAAFYGIYIWSGLIATVAVGRCWMLIADRFLVSQAKRAFAFIGTGGLVGAMSGSALSVGLMNAVGPRGVLLAAGICFALTAFVPLFFTEITREAEPMATEDRPWANFAVFRESSYLRQLLLLVFASAVTTTLADLAFKSTIAATVSPERLGVALAGFYTGLNTLGFIVQTFLSARVVRALGVNKSLVVLPTTLALCGGGLFATGALLPALLMKAFDGSLRHSLYRTSQELLFVPLGPLLRARSKNFIDGIGLRGGQGMASLIALGLAALGLGPRGIAAMAVLAVCVWLFTIVRLRKHYLELFREHLSEISETSARERDIDLGSLETLLATLSSPDDDQVILALNMLAKSGRANLIPAFILHHPSEKIVLRSLELLANSDRNDFWPVTEQLMNSGDPKVRAAAVWAYALKAPAPNLEALRELLDDANVATSAQALMALHRLRGIGTVDFEARLDAIARDATGKIALVRAIRMQSVISLDQRWLQWAQENDPRLICEIARLMRTRPDPTRLPMLLPWLAERATRADARKAVLAMGETVRDALVAALGQEDLGSEVRRHLPRTLSRFPEAEMASVLLERLVDEKDPVVAYKILRGIGRMTAENPDVRLDVALIDKTLKAAAERARLLTLRHAVLSKVSKPRVLLNVIAGLIEGEVETIFRVLGVRYPLEDFHRIYRGVFSRDERVASSSWELLENFVKEPVRGTLRALVGNAPLENRLVETPAQALKALANDSDETLRALARDELKAEVALAS